MTLYAADDTASEAPPRRNGELAFDEPWQSRAFGIAAAVVEVHLHGDREPFRQQLIAAIAEDDGRPYWDSWVVALERTVVDLGLVAQSDLTPPVPEPLQKKGRGG